MMKRIKKAVERLSSRFDFRKFDEDQAKAKRMAATRRPRKRKGRR